jgi:hypothetical protein
MGTHRARAATAAALLVVLLASANALATSTGIRIIEPPLVTQQGVLTFSEPHGGIVAACNAMFTKTLITERLIPVMPGLVKLGKVTSGILSECPAALLNLPPVLGGQPEPGPLPESWDISYLSSNLPEGELNFGILDFQVQLLGPAPCLYRGALLGTLSTEGMFLNYNSPLPLFGGGVECPPFVNVEGAFVSLPPILYVLLP